MLGRRRLLRLSSLALSLTAVAACGNSDESTATDASAVLGQANEIQTQNWPRGTNRVARDASVEARVQELLSAMTLEQKVGQTIQADIGSVTPDEAREYRLGSILNGGSSGPYGDDRAPVGDWLRLADEFWDASMDARGVSETIPIIWGIDAVHGHSNVVGATIFPHNIGLGAANDPLLIERIGAATAKEIVATGLDWTFAPTLAVARDDRWGRTYESYSEDPEIVAAYGGAMVRGLQGVPGSDGFLGPDRVIATAKHFIADGGTFGGKDQGDARISESELIAVHAAGYYSAIDAGVQSVMASFSSWNGQKMHGNRSLLNDVLYERLGFDGFVVGDWNGHGKLPGCSNDDCAAALNAGVDMYMAPDSWKGLYAATLAAVQSGEISMQRLDEAVARVLRVKLLAGVFEKGRPSSRPLAGNEDSLSSPEHRALAREAVRKSLVLLKNNAGVVPLSRESRVLVIGTAASDMSRQTGGWTISWQGLDTTHADFPDGQTILEGIHEAVNSAGGEVEYSADGAFNDRPDVAILVFGEKPYAEFKGDLTDLEFKAGDERHLATAAALRAEGIPVVSVFLSGRPLWVNREINVSDAFVAAWLPGTAGGGIADVLFEQSAAGDSFDFAGKLSFSWPKTTAQATVNRGDNHYDPLFAYGYGLSKSDTAIVAPLDEAPADSAAAVSGELFVAGQAVEPWLVTVRPDNGAIDLAHFDRFAQEDALRASWNGQAALVFSGAAADMSHLAQPDAGWVLSLRLDSLPQGAVRLSVENDQGALAELNISKLLSNLAVGEWTEVSIPLRCVAQDLSQWEAVTAPLVLTATAPLSLSLSRVEITGLSEADQVCAETG